MRFKALDMRRTAAFRAQVMVAGPTRENPIDPDAHAGPSPEARLDARDELRAIARMKLTWKQLEVVALAAQGYTAREIGEMLGIPEDTAATYLKRARKAYVSAKRRR